ncbi:MAG: outer membrane protein assembly factor BamA, partial [Deltaproteobacteria bacterium]|nr:outer membrane protein assembly factor BamA [Deltaproteobacteria bacterium]
MPFDMHSATDISGLRRDVMEVLASTLKREGVEITGLERTKELFEKGVRFDEETSAGISKEAGARFAILGSVTLLEKTYAADWRILDVSEGRVVRFYYKSGASPAELSSMIKDAAPSMSAVMSATLEKKPLERGDTIERITVEGMKRMDSEAVLKKIKSAVGHPYSADDVKDDIHVIFDMGYFDDIAADLSDSETGKELTFVVREKPFVKKITLDGNKKMKEEKIKEILTIKGNTVLNPLTIKADGERIKALYVQNGYYLAEVADEEIEDGVDATVIFHIKEGEPVKVRRIKIIGNRAFSDKGIKGVMTTREAGMFSSITGSGSFNEDVFENDLALIMKNYYDHGYIKADILDYRVILSEDKRWFFITIAVTEGDQYRLGNIDITGDVVGEKKSLLKKLKLKTNEVFNRSKLAKGIDALTDVYGDSGFANAEFTPMTSVDGEKKTVDLTIKAEKNEPVYIDRIDITGNVRTKDKVIRRELEFGEGDLFSTSYLKKSRNNLKRLGYFDDVNITKSEGGEPDRVKLDVDVKERPTGMVTFGVGYSTVDHIIATASVSQSNLMGTGLKLDLSATIGSKSSQYVFGFTEPWFFDKPLSAGFDLFDTSKDYSDFSMKKRGFNLRAGFPISRKTRTTKVYTTYRHEDVNVTKVSPTASPPIKDQEGKSTVSSVTTLIKHDTRDDIFFPREGDVMTASVEVAGGALGGTTNYVRYEGDAAKFFGLPWDTAFSIRGAAGRIQGFGGKAVPLYERYFLGGINSIRGFQSRSLSPKDPVTGELIGGDTKLVITSEFIFPLFPKENLRGVLFFDAGNAYNGAVDLGNLREGAGAGIRWFSPIGPLRIEWGYNLSPEKGE